MLSKLFVPDTLNYMIAGYLVICVMLFSYILSIFMRWRKTYQEYVIFKKND